MYKLFSCCTKQGERNEYNDFLVGETLETYTKNIGMKGVYGDNMTIKCLSEILNVNMRIIQGNGPDIIIMKECASTTLVLGYLNDGLHYVSVRDNRR